MYHNIRSRLGEETHHSESLIILNTKRMRNKIDNISGFGRSHSFIQCLPEEKDLTELNDK